jgi:hypothetical protein
MKNLQQNTLYMTYSNKNDYSQREWDRTVGYGKVPKRYMTLNDLERKHKELSKEVASLEKQRSVKRDTQLWNTIKNKKKQKLDIKTRIERKKNGL